jgi:lipopolysaccharide export system protein LptA
LNRRKYTVLTIFVLCLWIQWVPIAAQTVRQVHIVQSDGMFFDKKKDPDLRRLVGNVHLRHDSVEMFCDSAYFWSKLNYFRAYSRVRVIQGDTLFLFGDSLDYEGNTSLGRVRNNVRLKDKTMTLTTHSLDFDMNNNISFFTGGGDIVDSSNHLSSYSGYYHADNEEFIFRQQVVLTTPDYLIHTDTLFYRTGEGIARFNGPTTIQGDSTYLYGENGYYHSTLRFARLGKNSYLRQKETSMNADSIFYNEAAGFAKAYRNVTLRDSIEQVILKGNHAFLTKRVNTQW